MKIIIKEKKYADKLVLKNFEANFLKGELSIVTGRSGTGKSTLFNIISGYDEDFIGEISSNAVSYVPQDVNLLEEFSIKENAMFAYENLDIDLYLKLLNEFGLEKLENKKAKYLSGGERQRVSILKAILCGCDFIILDEPTSSLDFKNAKLIFDFLKQVAKKYGVGIILSTHNNELLDYADVIYRYSNFCFEKEIKNNITSNVELKNIVKINYKKLFFLFQKKYQKKLFSLYVMQLLIIISCMMVFYSTTNMLNSDWLIKNKSMDPNYSIVSKFDYHCVRECDYSELDFTSKELEEFDSYVGSNIDINEKDISNNEKDISNNELESIDINESKKSKRQLRKASKEVVKTSDNISDANYLTQTISYKFATVSAAKEVILAEGLNSQEYYLLSKIKYGTLDFKNENDVVIPLHLGYAIADEKGKKIDEIVNDSFEVNTTNGKMSLNIIGIYNDEFSRSPKDLGSIFIKGNSEFSEEIFSRSLYEKFEKYDSFSSKYPTESDVKKEYNTGIIKLSINSKQTVDYENVFNKKIDFKNNYMKEQFVYDIMKVLITILICVFLFFEHKTFYKMLYRFRANEFKCMKSFGLNSEGIKKYFHFDIMVSSIIELTCIVIFILNI